MIESTPTGTSNAPLNMVLGQLTTNQILDSVLLNAIVTTPRERFVPETLAGACYVDNDLPIGMNRVVMAPLTFARLLALSEVKATDRVLDLACGYGYSSVVLSKLCTGVVACDDANFISHAKAAANGLGIDNIAYVPVDALSAGVSQFAPYDVIFINGAIEMVPDAIAAQLAEGGRLVAVQHKNPRLGLANGMGRVAQCRKINGELFYKELMEASLPLLPGFSKPAKFQL